MSNSSKTGISHRLPIEDLGLLSAMGIYGGMSAMNKFGRNAAVVSGGSEEIWDGSAVYSFPATALMTSISQTTDQSTLRGESVEIQGLDANWALVTQTAVLDGTLTTNVVTLSTPLIRCFRMEIQSAVVSTSPIRVHNAGETQDYAIVSTGQGQTLMAIYTVPAGKTAYMHNFYGTFDPAAGSPTSLLLKLWAKDNANGYAKQIKHIAGINISSSSTFTREFYPYKRFPEKTDIFLEGTTVGAAADVSAGFDLIVCDNDV